MSDTFYVGTDAVVKDADQPSPKRSVHPLSTPAKLCKSCVVALKWGLEDVIEKTMHVPCAHHATFADFQEAVAQKCFICMKFWDSIHKEMLAKWETNKTTWLPLKCSLSRRPWAPERYGAIYWHIVYMQFDLQHWGLDMWNLNYQGNVFCLLMDGDDNSARPGDVHESEAASASEGSTASNLVHKQAYTWYQACRYEHKTCQKLGLEGNYTPTRLIDVGSKGDDTWKLCMRTDDIADFPDYLTLSYRWAKDPTLLLRNSTIDTFRRGVPISSLPRTFRDAITVARSFSIRYLWIDSLCIIQDSPEDWARESILMHDVYANSACNIAASASETPEGGLFRSRVANGVTPGYINVDLPSLGTKKFQIWDQFYMDRLTHGPLTNRGWVFQERVLSPRVLHFSKHQIAWECFEMNKCETFPGWSPCPTEVDYYGSSGLKMLYAFFNPEATSGYGPLKNGDENKTMNAGVYEQWMNLLKTYTRCAFTCPDDRLVAMAGVAKLFERHTSDEYLAGLWRSRLVEGLNWVVVNPLPPPHKRSRVPSWSWAAVDSAILPQRATLAGEDDLIEIIDAMVDDRNASAGWREVHGQIKMRGCLTKATTTDSLKLTIHTTNASATRVKLLNFPSKVYILPDTIDMIFTAGEQLHLLPLRTILRQTMSDDDTKAKNSFGTTVLIIEGLILECVAKEGDNYRRVGRFIVDDLDHVGYLGLHADPPSPGGTVFTVTMDEAHTSVITVV